MSNHPKARPTRRLANPSPIVGRDGSTVQVGDWWIVRLETDEGPCLAADVVGGIYGDMVAMGEYDETEPGCMLARVPLSPPDDQKGNVVHPKAWTVSLGMPSDGPFPIRLGVTAELWDGDRLASGRSAEVVVDRFVSAVDPLMVQLALLAVTDLFSLLAIEAMRATERAEAVTA